MLIFGSGGDSANLGYFDTMHCPKCNQKTSFYLHLDYRYQHIWYIFGMVTKKEFYRICEKCGDTRAIPAHEAMQKVDRLPIPFYRRYGWVGFVALVVIAVFFAATESSEREYSSKAYEYNERGEALHNKGDFAGAVREYSRALEQSPKNPAIYFNRGSAKMELGDYPGSVEDFTKAVEYENDPESKAIVYAYRGFSWHKLGNINSAASDYESAIASDPECALAISNLAAIKFDRGDVQGALKNYTRAIELFIKQGSRRDAAESHSGRAFVRVSSGDLDGALKDCDMAIEYDPQCAIAHSRKAQLLSRKGDFESAAKSYTKAIELFAQWPSEQFKSDLIDSFLGRGVALAYSHENEKAQADFDMAIELDPDNPYTFYLRGNARASLRSYDKALQDYSRAVEMFTEMGDKKSTAEVLGTRANVKTGKYDFVGALEDCEAALKLEPDSLMAYICRGSVRNHLGEYDLAIKDFNAAIRLSEEANDKKAAALSLSCRAGSHYFKRDYAGALADENEAINTDPDCMWAYGGRAMTYAKGFNEIDKAIRDAGKAIEMDPEDSYGYTGRAYALARKGEFDKALADCDKALQLEEDSAGVWYKYALVLAFKKDSKGMLEKLAKAVELNPCLRRRARQDEDFKPYFKDPEFIKITSE